MTLLQDKLSAHLVYSGPKDIERIKGDEHFFSVQKTATTRCRPLTQNDWKSGIVTPQRSETPVKGHIYSLESEPGKPTPFNVGDMLAEGVQKELWRITLEKFLEIKERISEPDPEGWALYINTNTMFAIQMTETFRCKLGDGSELTSPAGSWLVFNEKSQQPVADDIFKATYKIIK